MTERSVVARALWELHGLGWRLDWVGDRPGRWREFGLRRPGGDWSAMVLSAPPKGWRS